MDERSEKLWPGDLTLSEALAAATLPREYARLWAIAAENAALSFDEHHDEVDGKLAETCAAVSVAWVAVASAEAAAP